MVAAGDQGSRSRGGVEDEDEDEDLVEEEEEEGDLVVVGLVVDLVVALVVLVDQRCMHNASYRVCK